MADEAPTSSAAGRVVLLAGATSASGLAAARALTAAGARVVAVGRSAEKLAELERIPGIRLEVCDLTDEGAVADLVERVHDAVGPVDGVLHLVGGWRGGGGLAGQTEADYRFLEQSFTALRFMTRAFDADLRESAAGRLAIISSTAVARPLAGGANYAAVKAASEAWTRAVAQGFAKHARDAGTDLSAAAVAFRIQSLDGREDAVAARFVKLWEQDAATLNDTVIPLHD